MKQNKFPLIFKIFAACILIVGIEFFNLQQQIPAYKSGHVLGDTSGCSSDYDNYAVCPKPPLPSLPAAGQSYNDPTYGTKIFRVTDQFNAPFGAVTNTDSLSPMFNSNGTLFYVLLNNLPANSIADPIPGQPAALFKYDARSGKIISLGQLPQGYNYDGAQWDKTDPNAFYVGFNDGSASIYKMSITTVQPLQIQAQRIGMFQTPITFSYPLQMSADGNILATIGSDLPDALGARYVVIWNKTTGKTATLNLEKQYDSWSDKFILSADGQYVFIQNSFRHFAQVTTPTWSAWHWTDGNFQNIDFDALNLSTALATDTNSNIYNFSDGALYERSFQSLQDFQIPFVIPRTPDTANLDENEQLTGMSFYPVPFFFRTSVANKYNDLLHFAPDPKHRGVYAYLHYAGQNPDNGNPDFMRYKTSEISQSDGIPTGPNQWYYDQNADTLYLWPPVPFNSIDQGSLLIGSRQPLSEELVQFSKWDGTWTFRRLAHTRMNNNPDSPVLPGPSTNNAGSLALFTSNWDGTLQNSDGTPRTDVFMAVVPSMPAYTPPPDNSTSAPDTSDTSTNDSQ